MLTVPKFGVNILTKKKIYFWGRIFMKKIIALTMITALSITIFAGCSKPTTSDKSATTPTTTTNSGNLKDGNYSAIYDHIDGKGWKPFLTVEIKDGKITKANFNYKNPEGKLKSDDANYEKSMKAKNGLGPVEYVVKINDNIVKKGSSEIDTVTGATHSTDNAKALLKAILDKAAKGDTTESVLVMNDTYIATDADFDTHGYKGQVSVTFKDGKISNVVFDEITKDGKKKRDDADYNTKMKAATKVSAKEAEDTLAKNYLDSQKTDVVTGATETSSKFKTLVEKAIASRK